MEAKHVETIQLVADAIVEAVEASPDGMPAGYIYTGLMQFGCTLEVFEKLMSTLVKVGRLTKKGHVYYSVEKEEA